MNAVFDVAHGEVVRRDMTAATLRVALLDTAAYTFSGADADLTGIRPAILAESAPLTGLTVDASGTLHADNALVTGAPATQVGAYVVYVEDAAADASRIPLTYIDTKPDGTPLAFTPAGDVVVDLSAGILDA